MICGKTTQWAFATKLEQVATNVTLALATRHDFAPITIQTPEAPSGNFTIKSAMLVVTIRDAFTAAADYDGVRIGIKLGAVAFDDVDYTLGLANTSDHETLIMQRDVTAYFVANYGTGATQTCQVGVAVATGSIAAVNNLTCELLLTYDYDNAAATHCKTVEIPIQGDTSTITTTHFEIGTAGTSPTPTNQIPQLTGAGSPFLPEAGITIRQCYLRIIGTDGGNSATDFNLFVKIDSGGAELTRAMLEQALQSSATFKDNVDLVAYGMDTTAAHALFLRSSLATTFDGISAVLVVTYTHTVAGTTRELHSLRVPLDQERGAQLSLHNSSAVAADDDRQVALLRVAEPGTITLLQSGVWFFDNRQGAITLTTYAPGQAERTHALRAVSTTGTGHTVRRCDHDSSTWALARGQNRLPINVRQSVSNTNFQLNGFAIVNYTSDVPATGLGSGNRSVAYDLGDHQAETMLNIATALRTPSFASSPWRLSTMPAALFGPRGQQLVATPGNFGAERGVGEDSGDGWVASTIGLSSRSEATRAETIISADWFKRSSYAAGTALDLTAARRWRSAFTANNSWYAQLWLTLSTLRFAVAGVATVNGNPVANGKTVRIFAKDADGTVEEVATALTTGDTGAFTANVPDDVRTHWASYADGTDLGRSADGAPGSGTFNIAMGALGATPRPLGSRIVRRHS